jgi:hypothetical protein
MQCYQCGARIRPGLKICSNCGARLDASTEYEGTGSAGLPEYYDDDGSFDSVPGDSRRSRDEDPGHGRRGTRGRDSYRSKADPLEDPRAPRLFNGSVTPAPRPGRREVSGREDRGAEYARGGPDRQWDDRQWDDPAARDRSAIDADGRYDSYDRQDGYRDSGGRGSPPMPGRRIESYQNGYDDSFSAEYPAEYSDPRGRNQRNIPSDRRRPQPETRDDRQGTRFAYDDASEYRDRRERRSAAARNDNQVQRSYAGRDQAGGYGQNGRRDRSGWRSRTGQNSPVLQLRSPAWVGKDTATGTSSNPSTRRRITIFVVVAVILVVSIGAVAARTSLLSRIRGESPTSDNAPPFVAYTPGPTPAPPSGYKEFGSPHSHYVLDYPQSWSTSSSSSGAGGNVDYVDEFTRATPLASVIVEEAGAFSSITRSEIIQAEVQGANAGGRTFTQISNPITTVEIAGEQWLRADYLITETDGTKFHMAILACHHNQRGYALVLLGLPDTFSQDTGTVFEPILNTFHFSG